MCSLLLPLQCLMQGFLIEGEGRNSDTEARVLVPRSAAVHCWQQRWSRLRARKVPGRAGLKDAQGRATTPLLGLGRAPRTPRFSGAALGGLGLMS